MSVQVKLRRDTAANIATFTPAQGEAIVDLTNNRLVVGDGTTVGGTAAAKLSEAGSVKSAAGAVLSLQIAETLLSGLSGASVTATNLIPAGALVVGCAARTVTTITGATSYEVGYGTGGTLSAFGSGLGIAAGSTNEGLIGPNPFYSATSVIVTSAGGSFSAGAVRLSLAYLTLTPATS